MTALPLVLLIMVYPSIDDDSSRRPDFAGKAGGMIREEVRWRKGRSADCYKMFKMTNTDRCIDL